MTLNIILIAQLKAQVRAYLKPMKNSDCQFSVAGPHFVKPGVT